MTHPSIGIANSVSVNFDFDPLDTIKYAKQESFEVIQIYLSQELLNNQKIIDGLHKQENEFKMIYYHADGFFNKEFPTSDYFNSLIRFLQTTTQPNYILHFDENINIEKLFDLTDKLTSVGIKIYIENYFQKSKKENAEKNIKKFTALFTLTNTVEDVIFPVIDIPRFFHKNLGFKKDEALKWCFQLFNFFSNKNIPILLHFIDCKDTTQSHHSYCPIGEGYLPYEEIFEFMKKTRPSISDIILEFEDKINPVVSRNFINQHLFDK